MQFAAYFKVTPSILSENHGPKGKVKAKFEWTLKWLGYNRGDGKSCWKEWNAEEGKEKILIRISNEWEEWKRNFSRDMLESVKKGRGWVLKRVKVYKSKSGNGGRRRGRKEKVLWGRKRRIKNHWSIKVKAGEKLNPSFHSFLSYPLPTHFFLSITSLPSFLVEYISFHSITSQTRMRNQRLSHFTRLINVWVCVVNENRNWVLIQGKVATLVTIHTQTQATVSFSFKPHFWWVEST